jgi:hypothetical protein
MLLDMGSKFRDGEKIWIRIRNTVNIYSLSKQEEYGITTQSQ